VRSITTPQFRQMFADIPAQIQDRTRKAYRLFQQDPNYPSLRFKKVHPTLLIYSGSLHMPLFPDSLAIDSSLN
jgi:hypothetical protein